MDAGDAANSSAVCGTGAAGCNRRCNCCWNCMKNWLDLVDSSAIILSRFCTPLVDELAEDDNWCRSDMGSEVRWATRAVRADPCWASARTTGSVVSKGSLGSSSGIPLGTCSGGGRRAGPRTFGGGPTIAANWDMGVGCSPPVFLKASPKLGIFGLASIYPPDGTGT